MGNTARFKGRTDTGARAHPVRGKARGPAEPAAAFSPENSPEHAPTSTRASQNATVNRFERGGHSELTREITRASLQRYGGRRRLREVELDGDGEAVVWDGRDAEV